MSCSNSVANTNNAKPFVVAGEYAPARFHGLKFDPPYMTSSYNGCGLTNDQNPREEHPRPSLNHVNGAPTGNPHSTIVGPYMYGIPDGGPRTNNRVPPMYYATAREAQCADVPKCRSKTGSLC